jgi:actin related protein 2/3 complex, subunit 1A/1B
MSKFVAEGNKLARTIACQSFNWDRSMCAVCPNTNEAIVYMNCKEPDMGKWEEVYRLSEHTMKISAIDWSPVSNKIVTCSHDRNAFVWTYDDETSKWKQSLVILRINRAATWCKWSPDGAKFATASGSKAVPVCHFEQENDWWISKMIKKHKSTVLCVEWNPNSQIIATGGTDFKCRVFSAYISRVDTPDMEGVFGDLTDTFGELLAEFETHGWVTAISWSPKGDRLAFACHDSTVSIVYFFGGDAGQQEQPVVQTIKLKGLPLTTILFCNQDKVVGGGHDMAPLVFAPNGEGFWSLAKNLDESSKGKKKVVEKKESSFSAARNMFGAKGKAKGRKRASTSGGSTDCNTQHKGAIVDMNPLSTPGEEVTKVAMSSVDGRMIFWDV